LQHASATGWRARDWQVAKSAMRSFLIAGLALLVFSGLGLCAESPDTSAPSHPDLIIVRRFAAPRRIVVLDPSLGFSLQRGWQGVSPADRAASVARATAFIVADTVMQQLRDLGYDALLSDEAGPEAGGRALIISGEFRSSNPMPARPVAVRHGERSAQDVCFFLPRSCRGVHFIGPWLVVDVRFDVWFETRGDARNRAGSEGSWCFGRCFAAGVRRIGAS